MTKGRNSYRWLNIVRPQAYARDKARGARCWICGGPIDYSASNNPRAADYSPWAWEPDHIKDLATHPEFAEDITNIAASHSRCNRKRIKKHKEKVKNDDLGTLSRDWG